MHSSPVHVILKSNMSHSLPGIPFSKSFPEYFASQVDFAGEWCIHRQGEGLHAKILGMDNKESSGMRVHLLETTKGTQLVAVAVVQLGCGHMHLPLTCSLLKATSLSFVLLFCF